MGKNYETDKLIFQERFRDISIRNPCTAVFIDVDSCLCAIEGIDELARIYGMYDEVALLTTKAMNGEIPFESVFEKRLGMIQPALKDLEAVAELYLATLTPFAKQTLDLLQRHGVEVNLLSAGYVNALLPLARELGIRDTHLLANTLFFDGDGHYAGYDETNPLTKRGGKLIVLKKLQLEKKVRGKIAIIGDSTSELEAKPVVDLHMGFGGWKERARIPDESDIFIKNTTFAPFIPLILGSTLTSELLEYYPDKRAQVAYALQELAAVRSNNDALKIEIKNLITSVPTGLFRYAYPKKPIWSGY